MPQPFTSDNSQDLELVLAQCSPKFILKLFENQLSPREGSRWVTDAIMLLGGVVYALCDKRNEGNKFIVSNIIECLALPKVVALSKDTRISSVARGRLNLYLTAMPGYKPDQKMVSDASLNHHGHICMKLHHLFSDLLIYDSI